MDRTGQGLEGQATEKEMQGWAGQGRRWIQDKNEQDNVISEKTTSCQKLSHAAFLGATR